MLAPLVVQDLQLEVEVVRRWWGVRMAERNNSSKISVLRRCRIGLPEWIVEGIDFSNREASQAPKWPSKYVVADCHLILHCMHTGLGRRIGIGIGHWHGVCRLWNRDIGLPLALA